MIVILEDLTHFHELIIIQTCLKSRCHWLMLYSLLTSIHRFHAFWLRDNQKIVNAKVKMWQKWRMLFIIRVLSDLRAGCPHAEHHSLNIAGTMWMLSLTQVLLQSYQTWRGNRCKISLEPSSTAVLPLFCWKSIST